MIRLTSVRPLALLIIVLLELPSVASPYGAPRSTDTARAKADARRRIANDDAGLASPSPEATADGARGDAPASGATGGLAAPASVAPPQHGVDRVSAVVLTATKAVSPTGPQSPGATLTYTVTLANSTATDATGVDFSDTVDPNTTLVGGSVKASPVTVDDAYPQTVIGNVSVASANIPFSATANDFLGLGSATSITAFDASSLHGGTVSMTTSGAGMGQFTYNPPRGYEGSDSFYYTLGNATGSSVGTVNLTVSGMIWFVNNAGAAGDGRLSSPYNTLAAFNSANALTGGLDPDTNDNIFVYESATSYSGAVVLLRTGRS